MIIDRIYYNAYMNDIHSIMVGDIDYSGVDSKTLKKILGYYNTLLSKYSIYESNTISNFLYDIYTSLPQCDFTEVQQRRLSKWLDGFSENEIAESEGVSRWVVSKSIHASCDKILLVLRGV